ncbi:MAG: hypothetical protein IJE49_11270 [Agathobacter sp.]|nr:hypothetical protein [Agathobacter sp.]
MVTKGYGFSIHDIDCACPADLEPYAQAHKMELKGNDNMAWMYCGNYVLSAISVALEHCLAGSKARSEYLKEPVLTRLGEYDGLTQAEIDERELRKMLLAEKQWQMVGDRSHLSKTELK